MKRLIWLKKLMGCQPMLLDGGSLEQISFKFKATLVQSLVFKGQKFKSVVQCSMFNVQVFKAFNSFKAFNVFNAFNCVQCVQGAIKTVWFYYINMMS